jgi:hypothetical protein
MRSTVAGIESPGFAVAVGEASSLDSFMRRVVDAPEFQLLVAGGRDHAIYERVVELSKVPLEDNLHPADEAMGAYLLALVKLGSPLAPAAARATDGVPGLRWTNKIADRMVVSDDSRRAASTGT